MAKIYKGSNPQSGILTRNDPSPTVGNTYDDTQYGPVDITLSGFRNESPSKVPIPGKYLATVYRVEGKLGETPANGHLLRPENLLHSSINKESYATQRSVLQIRVHVPDLMLGIPAAPVFPSKKEKSKANVLIKTYPLVISEGENLPIPDVGSKIWVEFQNIYDLKTGRYIEPYNRTRNQIVNKENPVSGKSSFDNQNLLASAGDITSALPDFVTNNFQQLNEQDKSKCNFEIKESYKSKVEDFLGNTKKLDEMFKISSKISREIKKANESTDQKLVAEKLINLINKKAENYSISKTSVYKFVNKKGIMDPYGLKDNKDSYSQYYDKKGYLLKNVECIEGIGYEEVTAIAEEELEFWRGKRDTNINQEVMPTTAFPDYSTFNKKVKELSREFDTKLEKFREVGFFGEGDLGTDTEDDINMYKEVASEIGEGVYYVYDTQEQKAPLSVLYKQLKAQYVEKELQEIGYDVNYVGQYTKTEERLTKKKAKGLKDFKQGTIQRKESVPIFGFNDPESILSDSIYKGKTNRKAKAVVVDKNGNKTVKANYDQSIEPNEQAAIWDRLNRYWTNLGTSHPPGIPWSAAFVSYLLDESGFIGHGSHAQYIGTLTRVLENCQYSGWYPFNLVKNKNKIKIQVGDILVKPRVSFSFNSETATVSADTTASHGDVVYKIENGTAFLCGGNTVDRRIQSVGTSYADTAGIVADFKLDENNFVEDKAVFSSGYMVIIKRMHKPGEPTWTPNFVD